MTSNDLPLRRFTQLPVLLGILRSSALKFLDPAGWDDRTDRALMSAYARAAELTTSLALCFTRAEPQYHHWKVFAPGMAGVCIVFDRRLLLESFSDRRYRFGEIDYISSDALQFNKIDPMDYLFKKYDAFQDEREFRLLYGAKGAGRASKDVGINLESITDVELSPWLPPDLFSPVADVIEKAEPVAALNYTRKPLFRIRRCPIVEIASWVRRARSVA